MKISSYLIAALSAATLASSFRLPLPTALAVRHVAKPLPTASPRDLAAIAAENTVPPKSTNCVFVSTVFPSSLQSIAGSGTQRFCQCGPSMAGINLAVSDIVTTSYCALGSAVPTGYSQIPASNGLPITTPSPTSVSNPVVFIPAQFTGVVTPGEVDPTGILLTIVGRHLNS